MMPNTTQASVTPTSPDNSCSSGKLTEWNCLSGQLTEDDCHLSRKLTEESCLSSQLMEDDSCLSGKLTDDSSCSSRELMEQNCLSRKLTEEHGAHDKDNYMQDLSIVKNKERLHPMSNAPSWFDLSNGGDDLGPLPDWSNLLIHANLDSSDDDSLIDDIIDGLRHVSDDERDIGTHAVIVELRGLGMEGGSPTMPKTDDKPDKEKEGIASAHSKGKGVHPDEKGPLYHRLATGSWK